jgi:CMP-N,N'-diacetyllegionaminic acid synthase
MNIVGIIPARGGSKSVKDKNIKPLCGKPLIQHTIEFAINSKLFSDVIISSDSEVINDFCKAFDVFIIPRPSYLAGDESLVIDSIRYTVLEYEKLKNIKVDLIFLLEPTSPIRFLKDFYLAIDYLKTGADSVASFAQTNPPPNRIWRIDGDLVVPFLKDVNPFLPRQSHEKGFVLTGQIYGFTRNLILIEQKTVLGPKLKHIIVEDGLYTDIDNEIDFFLAESIIKYLNYKNFD